MWLLSQFLQNIVPLVTRTTDKITKKENTGEGGTNNVSHNTTQKANEWATRTSSYGGVNSGAQEG